MNIKLARLVTGEDILTEYEPQDGGHKFTNPLIVYMKAPTTQGGMASVGLSAWVPYAESKTFDIATDKVVFVVDPAEDLRKQYDQVFGLGLILPGQQQLITS